MTTAADTNDRSEAIFRANLFAVRHGTDHLFYWLLMCQWALAFAVATTVSSTPWAIPASITLGAAINVVPLGLVWTRPGRPETRHAIAVAQVAWSALLLHLTGGRTETHFHIFGSLAFLAFYLDPSVLVSALLLTAADHAIRGNIAPSTVFGESSPQGWRFLELTGWMLFEVAVLTLACWRQREEMRSGAHREAALASMKASIEDQVRKKTAELRASMERYRTLVEGSHAVPWEIDARTLAFSYISPQVASLFGRQSDTFLDNPAVWNIVHKDDRKRVKELLQAIGHPDADGRGDFECRMENAEGEVVQVRTLVSRSDDGRTLRGIMFDVTVQKKLEFELRQAQKLESVGRLAAGVAHEINTPVQFVSDSVHFVRDAMTDLSGLVGRYRQLVADVLGGEPRIRDLARGITDAQHDIDVDYLLENVPRALDRSIEGLGRVATIVGSMKEFAHRDQRDMAPVDLNRAIESTLTIARNEYKYVADLVTHFEELPRVMCNGGEVNQVILNLVVNAAHAIDEKVAGTERRGTITVETHLDGADVVVSIGDTGVGIPESIRERIFDPFFTTKDVGKGTGQGLAIARSVVDRHGGQLSFTSREGEGTTFLIRLPVAGKGRVAA